MNFDYNPFLVVLSVLVAVQASYVGLSLAMHISGAFALNRRLLIAGSAFSLAVGIWSMHFIGMLAIKTAFNLNYDVLLTLISFLVCVLVTGAAIYLASLRARRMLVIAAVVMGLGISAMHYIGMAAVHGSAHMSHDPAYIVVSIGIAIAASGLALWLAFAAQARPSLLLCAGVLGCAISGMHYVAMAGTSLHQMQGMSTTGPAISAGFLAVIVSIVAFSVSGLFMLTLIPDTHDEREMEISGKPISGTPAFLHASQGSAPAQAAQPQTPVRPEPSGAADEPALAFITLPVEKQGNRFHIELAQIVSVHANAHYTYLFNGREDLFCPLSMTTIVARLPRSSFFRTHRSYVVNLAHVIQVRKAADAGIAELDTPIRRTVPVSRTRVAVLRQELAEFQAARPTISG
ncbi:MAG: LytTR family transcriptional regulator DNA-binding domain-containing protein [Hyphomicrobiales bacterium]|nr:LytTR family transcriptional regulator DNA-binding domain-containing protein [Hyphomicrobiales bacterium]MDE2115146.1 LytTR family transcriptional regulator DNA-binding domain-containing protein [Hyphomicrobiales bacterium]